MEKQMTEAKQALIDQLNVVLSWELAAVIQYLQHSVMVTGPHRLEFREFFKEGSEEAHDHSEAVAQKIARLGGVPTVEPAQVRQAATLEGMLNAVLELEETALAGWTACHELAKKVNAGTYFWVEDHIAEEQDHVDEVRMLLGKVSYASADLHDSKGAAS